MKPYDLADVVAGLNAVQPYDWAGFFDERLHSTSAHAPLGGIERSGWKLTYDGERSDFWKAGEDADKLTDLSYSVGLKVKDDGTIADIAFAGPAGKAGISPSTKLIAVNGRQFSATELREAIDRAAKDTKPLELLIKDGEYYRTYRVDYHGGERYPHLVRADDMPDLLTQIIAAKAKK